MGIMNEQAVSVQGNNIVICAPRNKMTKRQALELAAWIVTLAEAIPCGDEQFDEIVRNVRNS